MLTSSARLSELTLSELALRARSFSVLLAAHAKSQWVAYFLLAALCWVLGLNYRLAPNHSESLPQSMFLIHLNDPVARGDYVSFRPPHNDHFPDGVVFTKLVVGLPGDVVTVDGQLVYVNGVAVGWAKDKSRKWKALHTISPGVIPEGKMYVMGLHKDSFDSRYADAGLVSKSQVLGKSVPLW